MTNEVLRTMLSLRERREPGVLCTIVKTVGSTPLKTGAQMLVRMDGSIAGTIGGGALEHTAIKQALSAIISQQSTLVEHRLTKDHNMCCGGTVSLFLEVLEIPSQCFIFGAGHVGKALASLVSTLDIDVTVIDGRPHMFDEWQKDGMFRWLHQEPNIVLPSLVWDSKTFAIIATHSHSLDRELLRLAIHQPFQFCGMIGSARKVMVTRKLFLERGWATEEELNRIDMPIGMDISASSPAEIAVSIAARIIDVKNRATAKPEPTLGARISDSISTSKDSHAPGELSSLDDCASLIHQSTSDYTHDFTCTATTL